MKVSINAISSTVEVLLRSESKKATKFLSDKLVIRATRKTYRGRIDRRGNTEVFLTIGRPNFTEREFIKACVKSGESFPVKKIQLKSVSK